MRAALCLLFPLALCAQPAFTEDGLEYFVCNGGLGLGGVRRASDPKHILVADPDLAQNLNLQAARTRCKSRVTVHGASTGFYFTCDGEEIDSSQFQPASKSDWRRFQSRAR
jgi:hypothetical protein